MIPTSIKKKVLNICFTGLIASLMSIALQPKPSLGAERISFYLPVLGKFSLSVDSLATFAEEGTITPEFNFYASRLDEQTLIRFREVLRTKFEVSPVTMFRMTKMPMGERFLRGLGEAIYTHPERNGFYAIRSALILAAADPEGLTAINVMRHFPTSEIQLNSSLIFSLIKEVGNFFYYNETTIKAIADQVNNEDTNSSGLTGSQLTNLLQPGDYEVDSRTRSFLIEQVRQTNLGFSANYSLKADVYRPKNLTQPAPLIVLSHGFTSDRAHFSYLAEHLASHGYMVIAPEHIGSNSKFAEDFLQGKLSFAVSPIEFFNRPLDITFMLDQLETHPEFQGQINWEQVGVLGHSFGGNTALVVSGAPLNIDRIRQICQEDKPTLNVSELLQCRASFLPPGTYDLQDDRIKAVVAVNPVSSSILGPESIGQITIPTMLLGGSEDVVTPFIEEQAHPFLWLNSEEKYLAVMVGGSHNSTSSAEGASNLPEFLTGIRPDLAREYLKAMSLAFFQVHLSNRSDYQAYLSSASVQNLSNEELPLYLAKSLTPEQLELAYGSTPPTPPIPEALVAVSSSKQENISIVREIQQTETLKIAMRSDAAPFGYIEPENGLWTGYCENLADSLGEYVAQQLNISSGIEVIKIPSNSENRFELVQQGTVHLECGPNTIRPDTEDFEFSDLFFASGTRFLVNNDSASQVNPEDSLAGIQTGVIRDTTTAEFIQETYPQAELVFLAGEQGRTQGVAAVDNGNLDTFVSDTVLLTGELDRQNLARENFQIIPEEPLTCDFYGLILPIGDRQWSNLVNGFLRNQEQQNVLDKWLGGYLPQGLSDAEYCLNKRKN